MEKKDKKFQSFIKNIGKNSGLFKDLKIKKYGKESDSPFELDIYLEDTPINIKYVGYGVSQSLPILVELFARQKNNFFLIQQPEVHLHPKAQASLGDLFYYFANKENKKFIVETHSDFIIDRYRYNIRKNNNLHSNTSVFFFIRESGFNKVYNIGIDENGNYCEEQPKEFRDFFIKEELKNLGLDD